jgi:hypothetical protein
MSYRPACFAFVVCTAAVLLTGCTPTSTGTTPAGTSAAGTTTPGTSSVGTAVPSAAEPSATVTDYKVTYGFAVPTAVVEVAHSFVPPPLRTLVAVYVGNHPGDSPAFQRMSFYFRGGFPSYRVGYAPQVVSDGKGAPIPLPGNVFLNVVFTETQAHNDSGGSSVVAAPPASIAYPNLKGYAPAGDFEGYVTYGLGLQSGSGALPIRLGELKKSDGSGGFFYVVFVDVKTS